MTIHNKFSHTVLCCLIALLGVAEADAQIGSYRDNLAIGVNGGYVMSQVGFVPKVTQDMHGGTSFGVSVRYTCEKYFSTICSIYAELNYTTLGWKERILDASDQPVINGVTGLPEDYKRDISYVQLPVFAHLAWGREHKGMQFFVKAGPQFGYMTGESTKTTFDVKDANLADRTNNTCAQDTMGVENKLDYGIAAGLGVEYSVPKLGHFLLEGRYYYGLGNIYGDSKRDYFAKSNHTSIEVRLTWLFDIRRRR